MQYKIQKKANKRLVGPQVVRPEQSLTGRINLLSDAVKNLYFLLDVCKFGPCKK